MGKRAPPVKRGKTSYENNNNIEANQLLTNLLTILTRQIEIQIYSLLAIWKLEGKIKKMALEGTSPMNIVVARKWTQL